MKLVQEKLINYMLTTTWSLKKIASKLNISEQSIQNYFKDDSFKDEYNLRKNYYLTNLYQDGLKYQIRLQRKCWRILNTMLDNSRNDMVRYNICKDVLQEIFLNKVNIKNECDLKSFHYELNYLSFDDMKENMKKSKQYIEDSIREIDLLMKK